MHAHISTLHSSVTQPGRLLQQPVISQALHLPTQASGAIMNPAQNYMCVITYVSEAFSGSD